MGPWKEYVEKVKAAANKSYLTWMSSWERENNPDYEVRIISFGEFYLKVLLHKVTCEAKPIFSIFPKVYGSNPNEPTNSEVWDKVQEIVETAKYNSFKSATRINKDIEISIETFLHENEELIDAVSFQIYEENERFWNSEMWD